MKTIVFIGIVFVVIYLILSDGWNGFPLLIFLCIIFWYLSSGGGDDSNNKINYTY